MIIVDAETIYKFFACFFMLGWAAWWCYFLFAVIQTQRKRAQIAEARVQELEKVQVTKTMNIYRDIGCSQKDHLPNCGHFGYTGGYLSEHLDTCPQFTNKPEPCNCNPKARAKALDEETHDHIRKTLNPTSAPEKEEMANEWISVKDRLPPNLTPVLAYSTNTDAPDGIQIAIYDMSKPANIYWHGHILGFGKGALCWMPLPAPPEEE